MRRDLHNRIRRTLTPQRTVTVSLLTLAFIAFGLSLGLVVRVSAMPVEARTNEVWYAYREELHYDFTAVVQQGGIYQSTVVTSSELLRNRLPVEPPVYRRVLLTKLTDRVTLSFPYQFQADRPGPIHATYWVEGVMTVPNLWQRPYPLIPAQVVTVEGASLKLDQLQVTIPVSQLVSEMKDLAEALKIGHDQLELRIRPVVQVEVDGQREPIHAGLAPEILLAFRGGLVALEVDEAQLFADEKSLSVTKIVPVTMTFFGYEVKLAALRQVALTSLAVFSLLLGIIMFVKWLRRKGRVGEDLKQLGTAMIVAKGFELPSDVAVVDVRATQQLIALHLQTERPVIRVGDMLYLLDGGTCYRLSLATMAAGGDD